MFCRFEFDIQARNVCEYVIVLKIKDAAPYGLFSTPPVLGRVGHLFIKIVCTLFLSLLSSSNSIVYRKITMNFLILTRRIRFVFVITLTCLFQYTINLCNFELERIVHEWLVLVCRISTVFCL